MKKFAKYLRTALLSALCVCGCSLSCCGCGTSSAANFTVTDETIINSTEDYTETTMYFAEEGGKRIFGELVLPTRYNDGGKAPTIILSHGYGGRYSDELDRAYRFAKLGYACFCIDFGGINPSSKTEGAMTDSTLDTEKAELTAAVNFISSRDFCDTSKLYLYGESMGGFVSTLVASSSPKLFKALILIYPALSIPTDYHNGGGLARWEKFTENALSYYGKEDEIYKKCTMPVLIQHGTADALVNISYSRHAAEVFPDAELIELAGAGHGVNMPWQKVVESSAEFISRKA